MQTHNATITVPEAATGLSPSGAGSRSSAARSARRRSSRASRARMAVESITVAGGRRHASDSTDCARPSAREESTFRSSRRGSRHWRSRASSAGSSSREARKCASTPSRAPAKRLPSPHPASATSIDQAAGDQRGLLGAAGEGGGRAVPRLRPGPVRSGPPRPALAGRVPRGRLRRSALSSLPPGIRRASALPAPVPQPRYRPELAHALLHVRLVGLVRRLTPEGDGLERRRP